MISIYHNPRCSKSRQTLSLLEEHGLTPKVILYLQEPPTSAAIKKILKALNISARELMRRSEPEYKEQKLGEPTLSEQALINAMIATPRLIERPIVVNGEQAAIGRPPENVLNII